MMQVELIVCYQDKTWENEIFFSIPEETLKLDEAIIDWLVEHDENFSKYSENPDVMFIGIYSWGNSSEDD